MKTNSLQNEAFVKAGGQDFVPILDVSPNSVGRQRESAQMHQTDGRDEVHKLALRGLFIRRNELLRSSNLGHKKEIPKAALVDPPPDKKGLFLNMLNDEVSGLENEEVSGPAPLSATLACVSAVTGCSCSAGCISAQALRCRLIDDLTWYRDCWYQHQVLSPPANLRNFLKLIKKV